MTEMKTSEVLDLAADLIEKRGWVQGGEQNADSVDDPWGRRGGPVCMEGAIGVAAGVGTLSCDINACPAGKAVRAYLNAERYQRLYDYNDVPGRTKEEVIAVLRAVSAVESAKESELALAEV
jgi:hypothetical protein